MGAKDAANTLVGTGGVVPRWKARCSMVAYSSRWLAPLALGLALSSVTLSGPALAAPEGQMTWGVHVSIAPTWFDPAETPGIITPFMFLYALHDALVKPMPDGAMSPCLATKWSESADGLVYDFELRQGVKFHNGDAFTAEDVKFSFDLY